MSTLRIRDVLTLLLYVIDNKYRYKNKRTSNPDVIPCTTCDVTLSGIDNVKGGARNNVKP